MVSLKFVLKRIMPDSVYLQYRFFKAFGRKLNLKNPKTFNEKIQWLKLYDRKPIYTTMVDKYEVKKYVADIIGEEYIIPTLGVWERFEDIDFDKLPNQFVLKCTHDSGGLVICRDKAKLDVDAAREKINECLKRNFFWESREWPYKNVKPRIIAEKYMEDSVTGDLRDYKFFCFNGVAKALFIASDRQADDTETKFDFYDMDFKYIDVKNGHPNSEKSIAKPVTFEVMRQLAEKLSKNIPQLRVDFYEVNGKNYFGELTFSHWSGLVPFEPEKWDYKFGEWIKLPEKWGGGYALSGEGFVLWLHEDEKEIGYGNNKDNVLRKEVIGLIDYKFFCFNGKPRFLYISRGLENHETAEISFYDMSGEEMPFRRSDYKSYHNALIPSNFEAMKETAARISKNVNCPF